MAKTYANTLTDALPLGSSTAGAPIQATGKAQNARRREYGAQFTAASQPVADQIVIAKPNPNELFLGCSITITATLGTSTLALQLNKIDGTTVTLSAAITYTTTTNTAEMVVLPAVFGTEFDGGEVVLVIAVAALPAAGTVKTVLHSIGY